MRYSAPADDQCRALFSEARARRYGSRPFFRGAGAALRVGGAIVNLVPSTPDKRIEASDVPDSIRPQAYRHLGQDEVMTDNGPTNLVLRYLRDIDGKLDCLQAGVNDLKSRVTVNSRLDRFEARLDRIERRLGLRKASS